MVGNWGRLGYSRYKRLADNKEKKPCGGLNGRELNENDRMIIGAHINSLETELGFPCSHCKQKSYVLDVAQNWTSLYNKYVDYCLQHSNSMMEHDHDVTSNESLVPSEALTTISNKILLTKKHQRLPGDPVSYQTWRQFVRVAYSHLRVKK